MPETKEESTTAPAAAESTPATTAAAETATPETNGTAPETTAPETTAPETTAPAEAEETKTETKAEDGDAEAKTDEKAETEEEAKLTEEEEAKSKMTGRVMIVTGASSGLGFAVANYLCEGGNDVILACRSEEKANRSIEKIKAKHPNALATYMNLDLGNMESVRKFVDDFHALEKPLHVLINNAGVAMSPKDPKRQYTADNFEMTMGTNHFGPYLLSNLLLEDLKKSSEGEEGDARIIFVASSVHDPESMKRKNKQFRDLQPLDLDNILLFNEGTYSGLQAYKNSKAANVMTAFEMARRLEGTNVTVNAVCPGFVPSTDLMRNASGMQKFFTRYIMHGVLRFAKMTRTIAQGGQAIISLATDDKYKGVTGKYIKDGAETQSSEESRDEEKQKKLFEQSGGLVRLDGFEPIEIPEPPKEPEPEPPKKKEEKKKDEAATAVAGEGEVAAKEGEKKDEEEKKDDEKKEDEDKKDVEEEKKEDKKEEGEVKDEKKEEADSEKKETAAEDKKE